MSAARSKKPLIAAVPPEDSGTRGGIPAPALPRSVNLTVGGQRLAVLAVAGLVIAAGGAIVAYGVVGLAWSRTVWEADPAQNPGEVTGVALHPGTLYRVALTTTCFESSDYRVQIAAWDDAATTLLFNDERPMPFTGRACRKAFETREFAVPAEGGYTLAWNLSEGAWGSSPHIRLVEVMMTVDDAWDTVIFGLLGGVAMCGLGMVILGLRPPPPGRRPVRVYVERPGGVAA